MKTKKSVWLTIAAALTGVGLIVFVTVMSINGWDFSKLGTVGYETRTYEAHGDFEKISIRTDTDDLSFVLSEDGVCRVVCYEREKIAHTVAVEGDTLKIGVEDTRAWYEKIGISFDSPKITVCLPKTAYASLAIEESTGDIEISDAFSFGDADLSVSTGDVSWRARVSGNLKIAASTGKISVADASVGALDLSVSTGKVTISDVACAGDVRIKVSTGKTRATDLSCRDFTSEGRTGDIDLKNVIAAGKLSIVRSTGDVEFDDCDAAEIYIETSTGDVDGSLRTAKVFLVRTESGDVEIPKTTEGGRCEIITRTGDIEIEIS